ncbi:acetyl-CoA synthetase [Haloplanus sp. C73]|uniref:acetyl-CoA synthetase n=1 Tax=Haloplanus sp. C73 TaxID=3421641 RepID=UPI003EBDD66B
MRVLGDVVGRDRRSDRVALRADRDHSYRDFCTTAWKAGHALSHLGVHAGSRVALAPDPSLPVLTTLFGAACLGACVTFDVDGEARAVVAPTDEEMGERLGRKRVGYGDAPDDPGVTHWEGVVWSENPVVPPGERSADDAVLASDGRTFTHREILTAAGRVVEDADIDAETAVALRASLTDPRAVVAGVVAPLVAGGTVVDDDGAADVVVGTGADATVRVADVSLDG